MELRIRQEMAIDHPKVAEVIEAAFRDLPYSDHQEQHLVARLRKSPAFVPELSLVAILDRTVVGHILLSKVLIGDSHRKFEALSLAPVSVSPAYQGRGIGSALIREAHRQARDLGFLAVVLLGHADYYLRFGYRPAKAFHIKFPFEVPDENCMVVELQKDALADVSGTVIYPPAFYEK